MKKALILAYDFPPYVSVGGLRPHNWYQNLLKHEVYPIIVTRHWDNNTGKTLDYIAPSNSKEVLIEKTDVGTIIKTPYRPNFGNKLLLKYGKNRFKTIRRLITIWYEIVQFLFPIGPKKEIYKAADRYLSQHKVDCIIATGDPFVLFKYAKLLSTKYNVPWIADYRDPWSQDRSIRKSKLFQKWCAYNERRIVPEASVVLTVSEYFMNKITSLIQVKKASIIYNGYDMGRVGKVSHINQNDDKLHVAYIGTIYDSHPIDSFLSAIDQFIREANAPLFRLKFYGVNKQAAIEKLIDSKYMGLKEYVMFFPKMQNEILLKEIAKDNAYLLFKDPIIGTKIYDYIALKRKILYCYTDDAETNQLINEHYQIEEGERSYIDKQAQMLEHTQSGVFVKSRNDLKNKLKELYNEFIEEKVLTCKSVNTRLYSREEQTKKLAVIIKELNG